MLTKAITYADLNATFRKGLRNGNWRKLRFLDKALFRAARGYARMRIFERGFKKAAEMLEKSEENFEGVFAWAPSLRYWLKDPDYIFWLGAVRR